MELRNDFFIDELQKIGKVGIFSYDIKNDIMAISETTCELFGISANYIKNKEEWLNIIHQSQREEVHSYFKEVIKNRLDFNKEYRIVYQNDVIQRWIEVKGKVFFDEYDIPEKLTGIVHDISDIKKGEERYKKLYMEFQEKEALLVALINSIPDLIFYKDVNSAFLGCNKAFEDFTGVKEKDIIGRTDFDFFDKEVAEFLRGMDLKLIQGEEAFIYEERVKNSKGEYILFNTLKTPYYDAKGNLLGLVGVSRDITERSNKEELQKRIEEKRKRLTELKEADRVKTEFFANISHELRTPINVIFSALQMEELMLKGYSTESTFEDKFKYIKMMKQNCYRLQRLINNLIDITKFDTGYFSINVCNHDIIYLTEEVVLSVADYVENKDISITFDTEVEEKIIAVDAEMIERIMLNLLSNAVKFTPSGGKINIKIEDNGSYVSILVKDDGIGIPKEKLDSIFERFVQVDKSLTRSHEGSGVGLSIVKSLIEQNGGKIFVKSKEGKGSEFIIHLPCNLIQDEDCDSKAGENRIGETCIEKINIEFSDIYN